MPRPLSRTALVFRLAVSSKEPKHMSRIGRAAALFCLGLAASIRAQAGDGSVDPVAVAVQSVSAASIRETVDRLAAFGTRNTLSAQTHTQRGIGAARRYLHAAFDRCASLSEGRMTVVDDRFEVPRSRDMPRTTSLVNVVAMLPGDEGPGGRVYVISGHYDSRNSDGLDPSGDAPGADDDASGTAAVVAAACALAPQRFHATLVFLAVAGEEQGLFGAAHWARGARARGMRVEGMVTNDIVGTSAYATGPDARRLRVFADGVPSAPTRNPADLRRYATGGENDSPARNLARYARAVAAHYVPELPLEMIYRRDRYLRGGDHIPFLEAGYAAVRFTEPRENFDHQHQNLRTEGSVQYGDLPEFVDADYVADVARVNTALLASLALAPAVPTAVHLVAEHLENDSTLTWKEVQGAASYRILVRRTTQPDWEESIDVIGATSHTLVGRSKDDLVFGVAAVSADGHASPPAYPDPKAE
jgi:Peptidase family M28